MAEEFYQLPESPVYNAETIRKIQDTDPVRASTIVNPVISRLIENTHAVKKLADKAQQEAASAAAAEEYSSESVYNAGSYCTRGGKLYKANQDILSAEPWTEAHWTETNIAAELVAIYTALSNKASGGYGFGDELQEIAATSAEETYKTNCAKVDAVLSGMPDRTAKLVRAYPPTVFHQAGTTVSLLYKGDANYAVLSNIGSADAGLCGWRMIKLRYPSSSPSVWMPFEWEYPPMQLGIEYRTVDRYNGKPVYAKAISLGKAPNASSKDISHGIENFSQLVSYTGMLDGANLIQNSMVDNIRINASTIRLTTNTDASECYVYLTLYYTKTTD